MNPAKRLREALLGVVNPDADNVEELNKIKLGLQMLVAGGQASESETVTLKNAVDALIEIRPEDVE
jgi:hypothetical protein